MWHTDCHLPNSGKHRQFQPWDSNYIMSIFMCLLHHGSVLWLHAYDNWSFVSPCFEMAKALKYLQMENRLFTRERLLSVLGIQTYTYGNGCGSGLINQPRMISIPTERSISSPILSYKFFSLCGIIKGAFYL